MSSFANYHKERAAFRDLFLATTDKKILLLQGASGTGKTSLLTSCLMDSETEHTTISIELRGSAVSVMEIFTRSASLLGWGNLRNFSKCIYELTGKPAKIEVSGVQQQGASNSLRIALNVQNMADLEYRQALLTEAWFSDIKEMQKPIIVLFDTYEQAPIEVKNWISGPFLSRASVCEMIRVVVAGQSVPVAGLEWGRFHSCHDLYGVNEPDEWLPVVEALGKIVPWEPALTYLAGICRSFDGQPSEIMKIIGTFPNANTATTKPVHQ